MTMDAPEGELPQDTDARPVEPSRDDLPETVGSFLIEDLLAASSDGISYLASDTRYDNRFVTLKVLPSELAPSEEFTAAIEDAVTEARRLSHRHLIAPLRLERHPEKDDLCFIVFPHVTGRQLDAILEDNPAGLPPQRVVRWADQLADALDYAHERRVLHRNICPSNVVIDDNNDAYLIGFGTSQCTLDALGMDDAASAYRSPGAAERASSKADDVYALAATIYAALDGGLPQLWSVSKNGRQVYEPRPIDGQSAQINMALLAGLAPDPESRPATARDFVQALQGAPIKVNVPRALPPVSRKRPVLPIAMLLVLAAAVAFVGWQLSQPGPVQPIADIEAEGERAESEVTTIDPPFVADITARQEETAPIRNVGPKTAEDAIRSPVFPPPSPIAVDEQGPPEQVASEELNRVAELLVPIESELSEARYRASRLAHPDNPAVHRHLWIAQDHIDLAKENKQRGNHAAAARAYERAIEELESAAGQDAQLTNLAARSQELTSAVSAVEWPDVPSVSEDRARVQHMLAAARQSLEEGQLAAAATGFDDVQQSIEAIPVLAEAADNAVTARATWDHLADELPDPLYNQLAADKGQLDTLLREAEKLFALGNFSEAESLWEQCASTATRLAQQHTDAEQAAIRCAENYQQLAGQAPAQWFRDERIGAKAASAAARAQEAETAAQEARFDDACSDFQIAHDLLQQALTMHSSAIEQALADSQRLAADGQFGAALTRLDAVKPFHPEPDWRSRRISILLAQARALNDPATKEPARQAVQRLLALDPTHSEALGLHEQISGYFGPEVGDIEANSIGMPLVFIPEGTFTMGSPTTEPLRDPTETPHTVRISRGFWLGQTEVTRGQFREFVDATGYVTEAERAGSAFGLGPRGQWKKINGLSWRNPGFEQTDSHPVVCISHRDARAFCDWLSEEDGRVYRLPTEAEWEYACRAGSSAAYPWGSSPSDAETRANVGDQRWASLAPDSDAFGFDDGYAYTSPVGELLPNAWGLFDMIGNAQEWCSDWYGPYSSARASDPTGPPSGSSRILRGGSFIASPGFSRCAQRDASMDVVRFVHHGFRVVAEGE